MASGPEAEHHLNERRVLQQRLQELRYEVAAIETQLAALDESASARFRNASARRRGRRPVRTVILEALSELGCLMYSQELAWFCEARYDRLIATTRFGPLAADERRSFYRPTARPKVVWLCFGLTHDTGRPLTNLWGRSDWPLEMRVLAPTTEPVRRLHFIKRLAELTLGEEDPQRRQAMTTMASVYASEVPGLTGKPNPETLPHWGTIADNLLAQVEPADAGLRQSAKAAFAAWSLDKQLFGAR